VKQDLPILVVIGNPPYNGFAGVSPREEQGLVDPYKRGLASQWGITKNYLDDLYVRFFRLAERRIAERTGRGVVCFISNFSYLGDPSFVVMRQRFVAEFDCIWIDCLNGDSRETGKTTPEGRPDPSVFSTAQNRPGIRVGTAVALMLRKGEAQDEASTVLFRHLWGASKREQLVGSLLDSDLDAQYTRAYPDQSNRYLFRPQAVSSEYAQWPSVVDLVANPPSLGLNDNRGQGTHSVQLHEIRSRMEAYFDPDVSLAEVALMHTGLATDAASFDAERTRQRLQRESEFRQDRIWRFLFKPFDLRWAYIEKKANLWNRIRPQLVDAVETGTQFLLVRRRIPGSDDGTPLYFSHCLADQHVLQTDAYFIPFFAQQKRASVDDRLSLLGGEIPVLPVSKPNLSRPASEYLDRLAIRTPESLFFHILAVGYAPEYAAENSDGLRRDWPRIPLPAVPGVLLASAELGLKVSELLDSDMPALQVTSGPVRPELRMIGRPTLVGGGQFDSGSEDLAVRAGWGHGASEGITMPGNGKVIARDYSGDELAELERGSELLGYSMERLVKQFGASTFDVYLNDVAYWRNIPSRVWSYSIGGYQVIKKWLSYREYSLLGRTLTVEEVRHVTSMARRIAAILLMGPALDESYQRVKENTFGWPPSD
jgi:hypothetical protein